MLSIFLFSCGGTHEKSAEDENQKGKTITEETNQEKAIDEEVANVMDWMGAYKGILPCADCEGIETTIMFNPDGNYQKTEIYIKNDEPFTFETHGHYEWDPSLSLLTLKAEEGSNNGEDFKYLVENGKLKALDKEGNEITSELAKYYILDKVN